MNYKEKNLGPSFCDGMTFFWRLRHILSRKESKMWVKNQDLCVSIIEPLSNDVRGTHGNIYPN